MSAAGTFATLVFGTPCNAGAAGSAGCGATVGVGAGDGRTSMRLTFVPPDVLLLAFADVSGDARRAMLPAITWVSAGRESVISGAVSAASGAAADFFSSRG